MYTDCLKSTNKVFIFKATIVTGSAVGVYTGLYTDQSPIKILGDIFDFVGKFT